jgi:hypothetical protein
MVVIVRVACWILITLTGATVFVLMWSSDLQRALARQCVASHYLEASRDSFLSEGGVERACNDLARSIPSPVTLRWVLVGGVLVGAIIAVLLVLLVFTPTVSMANAPAITQEVILERERIQSAASGTAKAAAALAAALVSAGFESDASIPTACVLGAILGIAVLLILAAEASHATRA